MSDQSEHLQTWGWCQWKPGNHQSLVETHHSKPLVSAGGNVRRSSERVGSTCCDHERLVFVEVMTQRVIVWNFPHMRAATWTYEVTISSWSEGIFHRRIRLNNLPEWRTYVPPFNTDWNSFNDVYFESFPRGQINVTD